MRLPGLLCGLTASAAAHAAVIPLLLWLAGNLSDRPARFAGQRIGVPFSLAARPGPPPAKVRGPKPQLGVCVELIDPSKTKIAQDKVNRKSAAPAEAPPAKQAPKSSIAADPKTAPKVAEKPRPPAKPPAPRDAKPERPATFLVAQPRNQAAPPDALTKPLVRASRQPALAAPTPSPKGLEHAGQQPAPVHPDTKLAAPAEIAAHPASRLLKEIVSSASAAKVARPPSREIVVTERRATMASDQVVHHSDQTGLHAVSLNPDLPTQRGQRGAKGAHVLGTDGSMPNFFNNRPPVYPQQAVRDRIEGTVLLRLHVAKTGRVTEVDVIRSSGHAILDDAAVEAIRTWIGEPRLRYGQAIASVEQLPVVFTLR